MAQNAHIVVPFDSTKRASAARAHGSARTRASQTQFSQTRSAQELVRRSRTQDAATQNDAASQKEAKSFFEKLTDAKRKRDKKKAKEKAGKAFERQFAGASSSAASEAGPRAAVYKGEMGRSQRRAQHMQTNATHKGSKSAGFRLQGNPFVYPGTAQEKKREPHNKQQAQGNFFTRVISKLANIFFGTPRRLVALSMVVCVVIAGVFMYPAVKQYYTEMRHLDKVNAEYQAVSERNADLTATRDYLKSSAGVEELAHEQYGWVTEGENSVLVYGLQNDTVLADTNLYIKRGSVSAPETWYSVILDPLFGVE